MDRAHRLRKGLEFDRAYREGTVIGGPLLVLRIRLNDSVATRWGFAVGKRISKKSPVRNRIRRRLREVARSLALPEGYDIIVIARKNALDANYQQLLEALRRGIGRSEIVAGKEKQ